MSMSDAQFEKQFAHARQAGIERSGDPLRAVRARFEPRGRLIHVILANGFSFQFPAKLAPPLKGASAAGLASITVTPLGDLMWESLDVAISTSALLAQLLGDSFVARESGRRGGRVRSRAKSAAARKNGRRGGRPRKQGRGK